MKLYTKTGDKGTTSVIGGRVDKDDRRVEAYGTIDELNAFVGQAIAALSVEKHAGLQQELIRIQHELFDCGSDLAYLDEPSAYKVTSAMVERLESLIDQNAEQAPPILRFILPGGSVAAGHLHVCRTVCRRAERRVVTLDRVATVNPEVIRYLNRLSDLLFAAARAANVIEGVSDTEYERSAYVFGKPANSRPADSTPGEEQD